MVDDGRRTTDEEQVPDEGKCGGTETKFVARRQRQMKATEERIQWTEDEDSKKMKSYGEEEKKLPCST